MSIDWDGPVEENFEIDGGSSSFVPDEANTDVYNYTQKNLLGGIDPSFESTWRSYWVVTGTNATTGTEYNFTTPSRVADGERSGGIYHNAAFSASNAYTLRTLTPVSLTKTVQSGTYTLSFSVWATVTSLTLRVVPYVGGVAQSDAYNSAITVSGTIERKNVSFTLPANTNGIAIFFTTASISPSSFSEIFTIDAMQLEAGSQATEFEGRSSFVEMLSSDVFKIRIGDAATDTPYFYVSDEGTTYASKLRLNAGEVTTDSTTHGFQIGSSTGLNMRMDSNEIQVVNNGTVSGLNLNTGGGTIRIGNASSLIILGAGTDTNNHGTVESASIYYDSTGTAGSAVHVYATSHLVRRFTSTYNIKNNISPLSQFSTISSLVPSEKITNSILFNPKDILSITPVAYNAIGSSDDPNKTEIGFIAEDIADKVPELAVYGDDDIVDFYNIYGIVASMLSVIQEQESRINSLEERLAILEG